MKVTDEMVQAALDAQPFTADNVSMRVWQCIECDGDRTEKAMRAALEAALSHAAGQEVVGVLTVRRWRGIDAMVNHEFEYLGDLPDGTYSLYLAPAVARSEGEES